MEIHKENFGLNMLDKLAEISEHTRFIKIMKIYSSYIITLDLKNLEMDNNILSLSKNQYIGYVPEHDLYLYFYFHYNRHFRKCPL